jgi:hypothetical protein
VLAEPKNIIGEERAEALDYDGSGPGDPRHRCQLHLRPGYEPGCALLRHPFRAYPALDLLPQLKPHGRVGQLSPDYHCGHRSGCSDRLAERLPPVPDLLWLMTLLSKRMR